MTDSEQPTERTVETEELLDWLCWSWATRAEHFYPPDETAEDCLAGLDEQEKDERRGYEQGYHTRAWLEARERFRDLENRGYDPKARAEREVERSRDAGLDLSDIDWSWWESEQEDGDD